MSKASEIIALAEDRGHQNFARGFLDRWGYRGSKIRFVPLPAGGSSGEQYVREHYPVKLEALRRKLARTSKALIVLIEADRRTTAETRSSLDTQRQRNGVAPRASGEPVCLFIPKRNIETWVFCLLGRSANEQEDYRARTEEKESQLAGYDFGKQILECSGPAAHWVPSLKEAVPEARRVPRD